MKRFTWIFAVMFLFFAGSAFAAWYNPISWVKSGLEAGGWNLVAYIFTGLLALGIFATVVFVRIVQTLKEAGEFQIHFADALADRKITTDELKQLAADARDVFDIWKKTPDAYIPEPKTDG